MTVPQNAKNAEAHKTAALHKNVLNKALSEINEDLFIKDALLVMGESFFLISSQLDEPEIIDNRQYMEVTHFLLSKGMKTFWAIRCTIMAGCDQDAMALSRNLLETEATFEFLTRSREHLSDRMDRFKNYEHIERTKNANKNRAAGYEPTVRPDLLKTAEARRPELIEKYGESYIKNWSGQSIEWVFKELERDQHYISHFSSASLVTHATYLARHQYRDNPNVHTSWVPSKKHSRATALIATDSLVRLATGYSSFHAIDGMQPIFLEINWNVLSRFAHDGMPIENPELKKHDPVALNTWGVLPI